MNVNTVLVTGIKRSVHLSESHYFGNESKKKKKNFGKGVGLAYNIHSPQTSFYFAAFGVKWCWFRLDETFAFPPQPHFAASADLFPAKNDHIYFVRERLINGQCWKIPPSGDEFSFWLLQSCTVLRHSWKLAFNLCKKKIGYVDKMHGHMYLNQLMRAFLTSPRVKSSNVQWHKRTLPVFANRQQAKILKSVVVAATEPSFLTNAAPWIPSDFFWTMMSFTQEP